MNKRDGTRADVGEAELSAPTDQPVERRIRPSEQDLTVPRRRRRKPESDLSRAALSKVLSKTYTIKRGQPKTGSTGMVYIATQKSINVQKAIKVLSRTSRTTKDMCSFLGQKGRPLLL